MANLTVNITCVFDKKSRELSNAIQELAEYVEDSPWCGLEDAVNVIKKHAKLQMKSE